MTPVALRGLYAITSDALCADEARLLAGVDAALHGGARLIQYRDKRAEPQQRLRRAGLLRALCARHDARFIVNDDAALCAAVQADGVHLGRTDGDVAEVRARLGADAIIGVSCADQLQRALDAAAAGASYVAFGRFFESRTKPDAPQAGLPLLAAARAQLALPICAIGGITPPLAPPLIAAGADLVAAVEGVFGAPYIEAAARRYAQAFAA